MSVWLLCTQGLEGIVGPWCWGWELLSPGKLSRVCAELSGCSAALWDFRPQSPSSSCAGKGLGLSTCSGTCLALPFAQPSLRTRNHHLQARALLAAHQVPTSTAQSWLLQEGMCSGFDISHTPVHPQKNHLLILLSYS